MITEIDKYPWVENLEAYKHQRDILNETWNRKYYALFWEMGVGKTKPIIETAVKLFNACEVDGLLVIAPKGAYRTWIDYEIPAHMPKGVPHRVALWGSVMNKKEQWRYSQICIPQDDMLDILCINVEAFSSDRAFEAAKRFTDGHYTMAVVDESVTIKSIRSQRTKTVLKLRDRVAYRRILSGAPVTQGPLDLFSQCEFLAPVCLGSRTYTEFRQLYANTVMMRFGNRQFPKIVGYKNTEYITERLKTFSSRLLKTDCLDLPPKIYETYGVEHTPEQARLYNDLRDEAISQIGEESTVSVLNALTLLIKLHQINCGHVTDDEGATQYITNGRIPALLDLLEELQGKKVIIWAYFRADIENIKKALTEHYPGQAVYYHGSCSDIERAAAVKAFKTQPETLFFVATQATAGRSITLTEATYAIYYSQGYNLEHRLQSEDRNHRIGQTSGVTYIDMVVPRTVDTKIVKALREKRDLAATILDDFRGILTADSVLEDLSDAGWQLPPDQD